jgi:3-dehydroquinate dehydratase / shikimate dehydrogenase
MWRFLEEAHKHRLALRLMKNVSPKICVPVCVQRAVDLKPMIARVAEVADIVEVRLDCLDDKERENALPFLRDYLSRSSSPFSALQFWRRRGANAGTPLILTLRSGEQGGHTTSNFETRRRFWTSLIKVAGSALIDLELDMALSFIADESAAEPSIDWSRVICSHHDFSGVPSDLDQVYERMAATPARILKIAVKANDATDCLPIFQLLERAQREGREMVAIAMGQAGVMTRILGPSRGSFLTYGAFSHESATAPGQLTATELRELYRIEKVNEQTEIVGLIGNPVGHSVSAHVHNAAFAAAAVNAVYIPFQVTDATQFLRRMAHPRSRELDWKLHGLSVTAPHKSVVIGHLDWIDATAKEIGAVNTILVTEDGLHGYNTDARGFIRPLRRDFGSLRGARCAVIGAGGAARAALWALARKGAHVTLFARNPDKARPMAEAFGAEYRPLSSESFDTFDIVINATPLGTQGALERDTPVTRDQLRGVRLAYDLVYNPAVTRFLNEAPADCEVLGGIAMLLAQATEQFKLWTGKDPDAEVMRAAAVRALE